MTFNALSKTRRGQSRILEAVIAAVIIFIVFSATAFLIRASDVKVLQERGDLDRLGYNVLNRIVESGTIEATLEGPNPDLGFIGDQLRTITQKSLPPTIYFNLTIFKCYDSNEDHIFELERVTAPNVNNTLDDSFANSKEVSSTTMSYTSKKGNFYYLVLVLARAGEGD